MSCSPNCAKDEPPVSHFVRPSSIPAPVSSSTISARALTPSRLEALKSPIPFMKGSALVINADRFSPILGRTLDTSDITLPTRPPMSDPIASPILLRSLAPSSISQWSPGICSIPARAVNSNISSATTPPIAITPAKAGAANTPSPPRARRMPENFCTASNIFPTMSVSVFVIASNTPSIRANITFTAESISSGSRFATPSRTSMIMSNTRSIICGT